MKQSMLSTFLGIFFLTNLAFGQNKFATEEHFQELFMTAGYSTAFGAALGAAALGLTDSPAEKLQYLATGASIGFITGSIIGTYIIFTPIFSYRPQYGLNTPLTPLSKSSPLELKTEWNLSSNSLDNLHLNWLLTEF